MISQVKFIEIRDAGTFIPAVAIKFYPMCINEPKCAESGAYLLRRAGWKNPPIFLIRLLDGECRKSCYDWPSHTRTMPIVHMSLCGICHNEMIKERIRTFDEIESGDVIDVEYIIGETNEIKESERVTVGEF